MKRIISFAILFASYNLNANELYNCLKIADYKCTLTIFENWKDPTFNKQEYTLHKGLYDYLAALYQSGQEDSVTTEYIYKLTFFVQSIIFTG